MHYFKAIIYRQYVHDTFLIFRRPQDADLFLDYLNSQHPSITFTADKEDNKELHQQFRDKSIEIVQQLVVTKKQAPFKFRTIRHQPPSPERTCTLTALVLEVCMFLLG